MNIREIEIANAATKIDLQVFKNLYDGDYLLIWNNGQTCGKYKTLEEIETVIGSICEECGE